MISFPTRGTMAVLFAGLVSGCASTATTNGTTEKATVNPAIEARLSRVSPQNEAGLALNEGIRAILAGDTARANRALNRAIKLNPDNANLHLLNAVAYHIGYSRGIHINRDLAETGYLVTLRLDPNNVIAAEMLGQLYLESGRYAEARNWIGRSLLLGQNSARTYYAFAVASYYAQDVPMAYWSIAKAERLEPKSDTILRAGAMIRAAAGEFQDAEEIRARYDSVETDALLKQSLGQRLSQWRSQWRTALSTPKTAGSENARTPSATLLAQAPTAGSTPAIQQPVRSGPISPNWSDCGGPTPPPPTIGTASTAYVADETLQLPALPSPCAERPLPRMAVIDVAIVRSQDIRSTSKGINLLDSLSITLGGNLVDYSRNITRDAVTGTASVNNRTENRKLLVSLGPASPASITYSLNIANATDQTSELLSRPSLVALDRQPSTFFAGTNASTVPQASALGGSTRVDHPTGVSLSVTPTFIDDDSMLLSVKAGRSFFQDPENVDLSGTVMSTRNMATANVRIRFNETLVLSGLNEREIQENESGVPGLKDVPLLQYLFKAESTLNFSQTLLVLLTPRRPDSTGSGAQAPTVERASSDIEELRNQARTGWNLTPNLTVTMAQLERRMLDGTGLYRAFRSGDLNAQLWDRPRGVDNILAEIVSFLYY